MLVKNTARRWVNASEKGWVNGCEKLGLQVGEWS